MQTVSQTFRFVVECRAKLAIRGSIFSRSPSRHVRAAGDVSRRAVSHLYARCELGCVASAGQVHRAQVGTKYDRAHRIYACGTYPGTVGQ